jgi:hypothetical protein
LLKRGPITTRHDHIIRLLATFAQSFQATVRIEHRPKPQSGEPRVRPDLYIALNGEKIWADVVVPWPCAPSHLKKTLTVATRIADKAATNKHTHYKDFSRLHGEIIGFAVDALGVWSADAAKLVTWIRDNAPKPPHSRLPVDWSTRVTAFRRAVSVAVQRGNRRTVDFCLHQADFS